MNLFPELFRGDDFVFTAVVGDFYTGEVIGIAVETKEEAEGGELAAAGSGGVLPYAGEVAAHKVVVQFFTVKGNKVSYVRFYGPGGAVKRFQILGKLYEVNPHDP